VTSGASESQKPSHADQVGTWAGTLALAEVGVGSFLHAAHIPMTGTMLSLNQALFLSRITRLNHDLPGARSLGFEISSVTALLKSFAPVGKRLTPMLAIGVQGLLFTAGTTIFGPTLIGVIAGSMLLAVWQVSWLQRCPKLSGNEFKAHGKSLLLTLHFLRIFHWLPHFLFFLEPNACWQAY
jgi:hypothetical protein